MSILTLILAGLVSTMSPWKEGTLDIHLIATGSGENTFIMMPDGTTMLVDAGQMKEECLIRGKSASQTISDYVKHFTKGTPSDGRLDYFLLTHFHTDHMDAAPGLTQSLKVGKIVDRGYPSYDNLKKNSSDSSTKNFIAWVKAQTGTGASAAERFLIGSDEQFSPRYRNVPGFGIRNLAANGYVHTGHGMLTRPFTSEDLALYDENMMSCAFVLRYGDFSYLATGDLPGSNFWISRFKNGKAVTPVVEATKGLKDMSLDAQLADLTGPVTALKLGHHGTPNSTSSYSLWKLRPQVLCTFGSVHKQPCPPTLERIADPQLPCDHKLFVTTDKAKASNGNKLWKDSVYPVGHIVIRVSEGGKSYQVFVLDAKNENYEVIYSTPVRSCSDSFLSGDSPLEKAEDYGSYSSKFDHLFCVPKDYSGTDEVHSLVILKDGKKIYDHYDTGHTEDELHVLWSCSKTFTSLAVGFAVQDGLLSVDDKVISFFREDELPAEKSEWLKNMTVRNLLTMSSGLGIDNISKVRSWEWLHPTREIFAPDIKFEPGSRYEYNSMNTYLLSEIVQRKTGMKTSDYLREKLFRPLGIARWEWEESAEGVTVGGWGLYIRTESLAKVGQFLLQKGVWEGKRLLDEAWIDEATKAHVIQYVESEETPEKIESYRKSDFHAGYGYQIWRCTHNAYRADGAKGQFIVVVPHKNVVAAATSQNNKGKRPFLRSLLEEIESL